MESHTVYWTDVSIQKNERHIFCAFVHYNNEYDTKKNMLDFHIQLKKDGEEWGKYPGLLPVSTSLHKNNKYTRPEMEQW